MQVQRPRTRNTENVAYENRSNPCGRRCTRYSKEGDDRKHQESIRESYCERDLKDRSACWDLRESTERCLVYEQND